MFSGSGSPLIELFFSTTSFKIKWKKKWNKIHVHITINKFITPRICLLQETSSYSFKDSPLAFVVWNSSDIRHFFAFNGEVFLQKGNNLNGNKAVKFLFWENCLKQPQVRKMIKVKKWYVHGVAFWFSPEGIPKRFDLLFSRLVKEQPFQSKAFKPRAFLFYEIVQKRSTSLYIIIVINNQINQLRRSQNAVPRWIIVLYILKPKMLWKTTYEVLV